MAPLPILHDSSRPLGKGLVTTSRVRRQWLVVSRRWRKRLVPVRSAKTVQNQLLLGEDQRLWRALVALWWGRKRLITSSRVRWQRLIVSWGWRERFISIRSTEAV